MSNSGNLVCWAGNKYGSERRNHEWKRSLGRPKREWEGNIEVDFKRTGWKDVDSTHSK
jgi:endo-alpha-1,4-polygalactosaminidase (GH114 family)